MNQPGNRPGNGRTHPFRLITNMPEPPKPALEAETIRRWASEQVEIALAPGEIDALKTLLNDLLDEIRLMKPSDRASVEPESGIVVQEWPS
jgi:hypothetical protein